MNTNEEVVEVVLASRQNDWPRYVVVAVVDAAENVSRRFRKKLSEKKSHDQLFAALAPQLVVGSLLSRSATSLMGSQFYPVLTKALAEGRYGVSSFRSSLVSRDIEDSNKIGPGVAGHDVIIWSQYDEALVNSCATFLQNEIKSDSRLRIGTPAFKEMFCAQLARLREAPRARTPWASQNDFAVVPGIGIVEMESGGQLDSSNVQSQVRKLIRGGLAYGDDSVDLRWALAYANKGEGIVPMTPLTRYLTFDLHGGGALLVGSQWWETLLPLEMTFSDLVEIVHEVGVHLNMAGVEE